MHDSNASHTSLGSGYGVRSTIAMLVIVFAGMASERSSAQQPCHSVARQWNEVLLEAIRNDFARPTVHARNLFHTSVAMWDAWATYEPQATGWLFTEKHVVDDVQAAREETISYAVYRLLRLRFLASPGAPETLPALDQTMASLGYDPAFTSQSGDSPAAIGNRIAATIISFGFNDGANEFDDYQIPPGGYEPLNESLIVAQPGNPTMTHPNNWQPLTLDFFIDQSGNVIPGGTPEALTPFWGHVVPFSLMPIDESPPDSGVYFDPGPPPMHGGKTHQAYCEQFELVAKLSGWCTPDDGVEWDISPASMGNNPIGTNSGGGYDVNPVTGEPYEPQIVPRGDYVRILAEFWADGPDSETPPGHWFGIANYVTDAILPEDKRLGGSGPLLECLEWDVKLYLALGGAMHDSAVVAWGLKGWYDYPRPVSAIRYLAELGQCTDPSLPSYHPLGMNLDPGRIELITPESTAPGERHAALADHVGEIAIFAWPNSPEDPETEYSGVEWIRAAEWVPYQRPSFVSPPFQAYVSGHSTFSRAAAQLLYRFTGSPWFPGGLGEFHAPQNDFLVFEMGPSVDVTLQWASYFDAADESGISRLYGGIHIPADDVKGRLLGENIGPIAFEHALTYFGIPDTPCPADVNDDGMVGGADLSEVLAAWGSTCTDCPADVDGSGVVDGADLAIVLGAWGECG